VKSESLLHSFRYAFAGVMHALQTQRNMKTHAAITATVIIAGFVLRVSLTEWAILIVTIGLVWQAELMNTALEAIVDKASPELHPLARVAKDCAAGAVIISAITAVCVGLVVFVPKVM
jgi:diacylglycerol kinase